MPETDPSFGRVPPGGGTAVATGDEEDYTSEECQRGDHLKCGDDGVCVCKCHERY